MGARPTIRGNDYQKWLEIMSISKIPFIVDIRKNNNMNSPSYGNYMLVADTKKTLDLKGFAKHLVQHGKRTDYGDCVMFLQNIVDCLQELLMQNQGVKLDGLGTFYPTITTKKGGFQSVQAAVDGIANGGVKGVNVKFRPEGAGDEEEKMTSTAMANKCTYEAGYVLTRYQTTNSKGKTVWQQQKTNVEAVLNPQPEP